MPARESASLPDPSLQQRDIRIHTDFADSEYPELEEPVDIDRNITTIHAPTRTLSPISSAAMNTLNSSNTVSQDHQHISKTTNGTIRSVPSDPIHIETSLPPSSADSPRRMQSKTEPASMPHSTKTLPTISTTHSHPPPTRQNSIPYSNGLVRQISSEFGPTKAYTNNNNSLHVSEDILSPNGRSPSTSPALGGTPVWSAAVGKANLGKSGRVIERLMGENDMLKRDLNIERLRAEESKQALKMAEGRMEGMVGEYEGRLHEAAVNKTLLKRRERQVTELKAQVEGERVRADAAVEREKGWRMEMERCEEESKRKVEEAQGFAALMEGRNRTMVGHWKEKGVEVDRTVRKLGKEIEALVEERRADDRRMNMLQGVCDQQAEQLTSLQREKEAIQVAFEAYKREQEDALKGIKERARMQEEANEEALRETQKVLGELKWALGVKKNVKGAQ